MRKIVYLPSTSKDLAWFEKYYDNYPELRMNGLKNYKQAVSMLAFYPDL